MGELASCQILFQRKLKGAFYMISSKNSTYFHYRHTFFFFFSQTFLQRIQIRGRFFFLKKKRLHHFNEFVLPSHENTGKFILELLKGLRPGELPHRMNTVTTREKLVAAVLQGGVPSRDVSASTLRKSFKSSWPLLLPFQKPWQSWRSPGQKTTEP